jgi:hypothetical protein
MDHLNTNQSFPAYSPSDSSSSLANNGKLLNGGSGQNYDYYDNTSTGLLEMDHYSRNNNSHYQKSLKSSSSRNNYNNNHYDHRDHMSHEEPYMNDGDELPHTAGGGGLINTNSSTLKKNMGNKRIVVVNNKQYTFDANDNDDEDDDDMNNNANTNGDHDTSISGSSSLPKSGSGGSGVDSSDNGITLNSNGGVGVGGGARIIKPPPVPKQTLTNSTAIFNNNVCVALGSGVESINKRLNSSNNYTKSFKPNNVNNNNNKMMNGSSNNSAIDAKNLKVNKIF